MELKLLGLLKLVRLLRLGRIVRYMKFKTNFKIGIRMFQLLFFLILLVHWISCTWYFIIKEPGVWVPPMDLDYTARKDNPLWETRVDFYGKSKQEQYVIVFYYSMLTMLGNDISPRTRGQAFACSMIIIMGAIVAAFIFGNMAALMATMNKKATLFDEQMDLVNSTMRQMKLPVELQDTVLNFMFQV